MPTKTFYDVLDLSPTATNDEIKEAYRLLVSMIHPDKFPSGSKQQQKAHIKVQEINEAYSVLKDPQQRRQYDEYLSQNQRRASENAERQSNEEQRRQAEAEQRQREEREQAEANRRREQAKLAFCVKCGTPTHMAGFFCPKCGYATDTPIRQQTATSETPTVMTGMSNSEFSDVFRRFDLAGGKWVPSFNLLAFFVGPLWYLIKGMWLKAVVLGAAGLFLISVTYGAGIFVVWLYYGFFANWDLYLWEKQGKQGW